MSIAKKQRDGVTQVLFTAFAKVSFDYVRSVRRRRDVAVVDTLMKAKRHCHKHPDSSNLFTVMGCTPSSPTTTAVLPYPPIERIYPSETSPVMMIAAPPPPVFVKSSLKKRHASRPSLIHRRVGPGNKSVNFDQQVLVKSRTPTPNKAWYEKESSTMPMRRRRQNDNDDDEENYDDPEERDEDERTSPEQTDELLPLPSMGTPVSFLPRPSMNSQWYQNPPPLENNHSFHAPLPDNSAISPINRIKVRRRLSTDVPPPQVLHIKRSTPVPSSSNWPTGPVENPS